MNGFMRTMGLCALALVVMVGSARAAEVVFKQGENGYSGTRDTYMRRERPDSNYGHGGGATSVIHSPAAPHAERRSLIEFGNIFGDDPGQISTAADITRATLRMYTYFVVEPGNGQSVSVSPLLVEIPDYGTRDSGTAVGAVCWAYRSFDDIPWGNETNDGPVPGVDYDDSQAVTTITPGETDPSGELVDAGWMEWDITTIAQSWQSGALDNNGLALHPGSEEMLTQTYWRSVEHDDSSLFPQLVITIPGGMGDADGDGDVDDDDLSLLLANWGSDTAGWGQGEFNGIPPVNDDDLSLLLANWTGALPGAVPEPATMTILAAGALILSRRRK